MAITYLHQPTANSIQSTDNPIVFEFSSDQTAQPNFCFIVETVLFGLVVSTDKVFPERGNRAHWDAGSIAMAAVKPTLRTTGLLTLQELPQLSIRVAERYGTTPATQPFTQSETIRLLKARCSEDEYQLNWIENNYPSDAVWLTDVPDSTMIVSKKFPIYASMLTNINPVQLDVHLYDSQGTLLGILSEQATTGGDKVNVQITPQDINNIFPIEAVARLEIYLNQSNALHVHYVADECIEFHQLNWMNRLGTYDQYLFSHNHEQEAAISAMEYKKQFGSWNSSNEYTFDALTSGDTVYSKTIKPSGTIYSGWISQKYQNWLAQIYYSTQAILFQENGINYLTVTDTKSVKLRSKFDELLSFSVNYKKTNFKSITQ